MIVSELLAFLGEDTVKLGGKILVGTVIPGLHEVTSAKAMPDGSVHLTDEGTS